MARYIDADKIVTDAIKEKRFVIQQEQILDLSIVVRTVYKDLADFIDKQPTADVVEVKHGEWKDIYQNKYDNHLYICSICSAKALYRVETDELYHTEIKQDLSLYCPCCGAKMDGGKAE